MGEYKISRIIAKKKKYIFLILMAVFILITVMITIVGSFSLYQYDMAKKNFSDNQFAKTIEITSYSPKSNETRKLNSEDVDCVKQILKQTDVNCKVVIEYLIHFSIPTDVGDIVFVKSFSDDFFAEETLNNRNTLITKNPAFQDKVVLSIPVIKNEDGGYSSDTSVLKEYECLKIDDNSVLNGYIKEDELIASETVFKDIIGVMFAGKGYSDVENIYVNVDSINDVKNIANVLTSEKYDVKHAFEYYDDLDVSISRLIHFSLMVLVLLLIFALLFLVGIFELTLKNSVGDIAILKHLGFRSGSIDKVYLYPMVAKMTGSVLIIFAINTILYLTHVVSSFVHVVLFTVMSGLLGIIALAIMLGRVNYYCKRDVLSLLEKYKVEE